MGTLKQWLGWVFFDGVIPTAALIPFAQHMRQHELAFYVISGPTLLLYFFILGVLGLDVPGAIQETKPDYSNFDFYGITITGRPSIGRFLDYLRVIILMFVMPVLSAGLVFETVRDGNRVGYFLGPIMIWVSGGFWCLLIRFIRKRRTDGQDIRFL